VVLKVVKWTGRLAVGAHCISAGSTCGCGLHRYYWIEFILVRIVEDPREVGHAGI